MKSPCLNCPNRRLGCHSECGKYKDYQAKNKERLDSLKKGYAKEHDEREFKILQYQKHVKNKGRKK